MKGFLLKTFNVFVFLFFITSFANGQQNFGLQFNSFNVRPENRTSLYIGEQDYLSFDKESAVDLSFDFSFLPNQHTYFGYILRLVNKDGQYLNLLYDHGHNMFRLTKNEEFTNADFTLPYDVLFNKWTNIRLSLTKDAVSLYVGNQKKSTIKASFKDLSFRLTFGGGYDGHFETTDVPPMILRNVMLSENKKVKYDWPLFTGEDDSLTYDKIARRPAKVMNAVWASKKHNNWNLISSRSYKGNSSLAFNSKTEELYVVSEDSVYSISFPGGTATTSKTFPSRGYHLFYGDNSVYNTVNDKLYNYYTDIHSITPFSFENGKWSQKYDTVLHTNFSQSSNVFVPKENSLFIIGGYGLMKYKNTVQSYSFLNQQWNDLKFDDMSFEPRYFAGGVAVGDSIYILGGYGSRSGDQMLNPHYIYDLLLFDIKSKKIKSIYTLPKPDSSLILGGSMFIDSTNRSYYTFAFSNERFNSKLQLIKGSLTKPQYELVGPPIPYHFHDILSKADLFYCPQSRMLLAVTSFTTMGKETSVNIYSISFPPASLSDTSPQHQSKNRIAYWIYFSVILLFSGSILYVLKRRKKITKSPIIKQPEEAEEFPKPASPFLMIDEIVTEKPEQVIYLFGALEMIDKTGNNISENLSPLLREMFLLILLNSINGKAGISPEKLNEILWYDKSDKDASNNRSVNMAKLKTILEKMGEISIKKIGGNWRLDYETSNVSIDLVEFFNVVSDKQSDIYQKTERVLSIIGRGSFLKHIEYDWLDEIKSDISNKVIDTLLQLSEQLDSEKYVEVRVKIANSIFHFDPVHEGAMRIKCTSLTAIGRHSLAKNAYEHFLKEYQKMYGESFPTSFNDLISK